MHMKKVEKEFGKDKKENIFFKISNKRKKAKQDALTELSFFKKKKKNG